MVNTYETVLLITPVLSDIQAKDLIKEYEGFLEKAEAKISYQEHWGLKKIAYPIKKKNNAYYHFFEYDVSSDFIKTLDLKLRRDEQVIRFLTTKLDKKAKKFLEEKRKSKEEKKD